MHSASQNSECTQWCLGPAKGSSLPSKVHSKRRLPSTGSSHSHWVEVVSGNVRVVELLQRGTDGSRRILAPAVEHDAADRVAVDGMGDGPAHLQLGKIGIGEVEFEPVDDRLIIVTARLDQEIGIGLERLDLAERDRRVGRVVNFSGLQRDGAGICVGDEANDDAVEIRLAGVPVVRIAFEQDMAALLPLLEDEGAGSDRCAAIGIGQRICRGTIGDSEAVSAASRYGAGLSSTISAICGSGVRTSRTDESVPRPRG